MSRPREAFKILQRKNETRVHLKEDEATRGVQGNEKQMGRGPSMTTCQG